MTEGRYTLSEIDQMRAALVERAEYRGANWMSRLTCSMGRVDHEQVERQLRTLMMNGTPVDEVLASAQEAIKAHYAKQPTEEQDARVREAVRATLPKPHANFWWPG